MNKFFEKMRKVQTSSKKERHDKTVLYTRCTSSPSLKKTIVKK